MEVVNVQLREAINFDRLVKIREVVKLRLLYLPIELSLPVLAQASNFSQRRTIVPRASSKLERGLVGGITTKRLQEGEPHLGKKPAIASASESRFCPLGHRSCRLPCRGSTVWGEDDSKVIRTRVTRLLQELSSAKSWMFRFAAIALSDCFCYVDALHSEPRPNVRASRGKFVTVLSFMRGATPAPPRANVIDIDLPSARRSTTCGTLQIESAVANSDLTSCVKMLHVLIMNFYCLGSLLHLDRNLKRLDVQKCRSDRCPITGPEDHHQPLFTRTPRMGVQPPSELSKPDPLWPMRLCGVGRAWKF